MINLNNILEVNMDQSKFSELEQLILKLDARLSRIEGQLGQKPAPAHPVKTPPPLPKVDTPKKGPSNLLGIVGVACLVLAMILLIKFSIDSGWLTPMRQLILATLFGSSLIAAPFVLKMSDREYLSLLPAGGVVILHLTVYGGIFYHEILHPFMGITLIWGIGLLSLWLLTRFRHDAYGILAIAGTYIGSALLKVSFPSLLPVALNILIWDLIFTAFAIRLSNRSLISIAAYFSLGVVALFQIDQGGAQKELASSFALIQFLQILIYSLGTAAYSVINQKPMREKEAWQLFPVYLFFYGLEFQLLNSINPHLATAFSIVFSLILLGLYFFARKNAKTEGLASTDALTTLVGIMLLHSIYVVNFNDLGRIIFGLFPLAVIGIYGKRLKSLNLGGLLLLSYFILGFSTILLVSNPSHVSAAWIIPLGIIYGGSILFGYNSSKESAILTAAHGLILLSVYRFGDVIGNVWVAPLSVIYAYAILVAGLKTNDRMLGKSAFPVIFFALGHFLFFNFDGLSQGERIITLVVMGGVIYAGGYVYRKIR